MPSCGWYCPIGTLNTIILVTYYLLVKFLYTFKLYHYTVPSFKCRNGSLTSLLINKIWGSLAQLGMWQALPVSSHTVWNGHGVVAQWFNTRHIIPRLRAWLQPLLLSQGERQWVLGYFYPFPLSLCDSNSGWTQNLNLGMIWRVFNHGATTPGHFIQYKLKWSVLFLFHFSFFFFFFFLTNGFCPFNKTVYSRAKFIFPIVK